MSTPIERLRKQHELCEPCIYTNHWFARTAGIHCQECLDTWPCDTSAALDALEEDVVKARSEAWKDLQAENARLREQVEALKAAVLDIDAHATGLDEDKDGFTTGGYIVSVGALHRALGVVGHAASKCKPGALCPPCAQAEALADALENLQATVQATCEGGQVDIPGLEILGEALDEADAALRAYREANHDAG